MPIDLVIDEREGGPKDGDSNNNANRSTADSTSHTDGASTPDMVSNMLLCHSCNLAGKRKLILSAQKMINIAVVTFSLSHTVSFSYDERHRCVNDTDIWEHLIYTGKFCPFHLWCHLPPGDLSENLITVI